MAQRALHATQFASCSAQGFARYSVNSVARVTSTRVPSLDTRGPAIAAPRVTFRSTREQAFYSHSKLQLSACKSLQLTSQTLRFTTTTKISMPYSYLPPRSLDLLTQLVNAPSVSACTRSKQAHEENISSDTARQIRTHNPPRPTHFYSNSLFGLGKIFTSHNSTPLTHSFLDEEEEERSTAVTRDASAQLRVQTLESSHASPTGQVLCHSAVVYISAHTLCLRVIDSISLVPAQVFDSVIHL